MLRLYKKNERHEKPTGLASPPLWRLGFLAIAMLLFMLPAKSVVAQVVTNVTTSATYNDLATAISNAVPNDTLKLTSNITFTTTTTISITKKITLDGDGHTISVSGSTYSFILSGSGASGAIIKNLYITKTDNLDANIIEIIANNITLDNVVLHGQYFIGSSEITRGLEVGSNTNLTIENCTFSNLRQPAYINDNATGQINNCQVTGTRGWVIVSNTNFSFSGNTWNGNSTDIVFIQGSNTINNYPCSTIVSIQATNNNARVLNFLPSASGNVHNVNQNTYFCQIQPAIDAANPGDVISLATGTYDEQVVVNKTLTIKNNSGATPIVNFTGIVSGKPALFYISANNVIIDGINFNVDLSKLRSAIIASNSALKIITVTNTHITPYGTPAGSYGDRNAVSVNYGGTTNYRLSSGGVSNLVFTNNTISLAGASAFRSGISADEAGGTFTGNTIQSVSQDILVRFANNGPVTISGNTILGGGVEVSDHNAAAGLITISGNTFDGSYRHPGPIQNPLLRLKQNNNHIPTLVSNNAFNNLDWGISLENYNADTIRNNTFTPITGATNFRHITINTKLINSTAIGSIARETIDANISNNTFNGLSGSNGKAIAFYNHWNDGGASFGGFTVANNIFNTGIANFIYFDASNGVATNAAPITTDFPEYADNGAKTTITGYWTPSIRNNANEFSVSGSAPMMYSSLSPTQQVTLSGLINDRVDNANLGLFIFVDTLYLSASDYAGKTITKQYDGNTSVTTTLGTPSLTTALPLGVTLNSSAVSYSYVNSNAGNSIVVNRTGIVLAGDSASNYYLQDTVHVTGAITPKAVTITATDQEKCFGTAFVNGQKATGFTDTGFVASQGIDSVKLTVPLAGAAANAPAGNYSITPSNAVATAGTSLNNYTITYVNGNLVAQPLLRAYVAGVANIDICAGTGVSLNYALYGPGNLTAKLEISKVLGGSTLVPLDTFTIAGAIAGTNLSVVLPDSLTPNSGGNDFITYRLKWISISSDTSSCIGITDGQVDVNVYPVPTINVALADSTVCSGTPVNFTLTNPNFVTGASYKVTANYGPSGAITGGTVPGVGSEFLFTVPNFTETLVNTTNAPVTVSYTFITKNNNPNKACQGGYITRSVVINPTPTVAALAFAQVCDGGNTTLTVSGLLPNRASKIDYSVTNGASTSTSTYTSTADALGKIVFPSMAVTMANNGTVYEVTMITDTATGCSKSFTGKTTTLVVDTLPIATYTFNGTAHVSGDSAEVCVGSTNTLVASNSTSASYSADLFKDGTALGTSQTIASGGSATWSFGPADMLDAGKYWIILTNTVTGCTHSDTLKVKVNPLPVAAFTFNGNPVNSNDTVQACFGSTVNLSLTNVSNADSYLLTHFDGVTTTTINSGSLPVAYSFTAAVSDAGTYYLTLTSNSGCSTLDSVHLIVNPLPVLTYTFNGNPKVSGDTAAVCFGSYNTLVGSNATSASYTVNMYRNGIQLGSTQTIAASGSYTLPFGPTDNGDAGQYWIELTNSVTGCTHTDTLNVIVNPLPALTYAFNGNAQVSGDTVTVCAQSYNALVGTNSTSASYTAKLYHNGSQMGSAQAIAANDSFTLAFGPTDSLDAGQYVIALENTVTHCTHTDTLNVKVNPVPVWTLKFNGVAYAKNSSVFVCDSTDATSQLSGGPNLQATVTLNGTIIATIPVDGTINSFNTSMFADTSLYVVTVMNTITGCQVVDTFHLIKNPLPNAVFTMNTVPMSNGSTGQACFGSTVNLSLTNTAHTASYSLDHFDGSNTTNVGSGSLALPLTYSFTAAVSDAGAYYLTLTSDSGCTTMDTFHLIVNPLPTATYDLNGTAYVSGDTAQICAGTNGILTATNPTSATYTAGIWFGGSGTQITTTEIVPANGSYMWDLGAAVYTGKYWIVLTNTVTGCTHADTLNVNVNPLPVATYTLNSTSYVSGDTASICEGTNAVLISSNATAATYSAELFFMGSSMSTAVIPASGSYTWNLGMAELSDAGKYWMVLTNAATGCTHADTLNVIVNPLPSAVFTMNTVTMSNGGTAEACFGSTVNLTLTNTALASSYTLTHAVGSVLDTVGSGSLATPLTYSFTAAVSDAGAYYLTLFSDSACSKVDTFNLIVNPLPVYTVSANGLAFTDSVTYCSGNTVLIELAGNAGFGYTVTRNGSGFASGTLGAAPTAIITGGADNSKAGTYVVVVTNSTTGCTSTSTFKVIVNQKPAVALQTGLGFGVSAVTNVLCYGDNSGSIKYKVSGGTTTLPLSIKIKNVTNDTIVYTLNNVNLPSFSATQSNLTAGAYQIIVFNTFGCSDTLNVNITQPTAPLSLQVTHINASCGGGADGSLTFDISGGSLSGGTIFFPTSGYDVTVTGPSTNTSFNIPTAVTGLNIPNLGAGVYTINVVDAHGCIKTVTHTIYQPTATVTTATVTGPPTVYTNATANVTFSAPGLVAPITFNYTVNGGTTQTAVAASGNSVTVGVPTTSIANYTYTITSVTDANGAPCNLTIGSPLEVDVIDGSIPDLSPIVQMNAYGLDSINSSRTFNVAIFNSGNLPTSGSILVKILKPAGLSLNFTGNPSWTVTLSGNIYTLTSSTIVPGHSVNVISGSAQLNPSYSTGSYNIVTSITNGSGGETNFDNNTSVIVVNISE